jgi:hypothetical protein
MFHLMGLMLGNEGRTRLGQSYATRHPIMPR